VAEKYAKKLGFRNWRADVQDRGRWLHLLEKAKDQPGCRADEDDENSPKITPRLNTGRQLLNPQNIVLNIGCPLSYVTYFGV
jgi:hypothetical protein